MMAKAYVVDASTSLKWVLDDEKDSDQAIKLLTDHTNKQVRLIAPSLWVYEVASGLKSAYLRKRISKKASISKLILLQKSSPALVDLEDEIKLCLDTSYKYSISIYDSAYITLAKANKVPLISSDVKLVKKINNTNLVLPLSLYK